MDIENKHIPEDAQCLAERGERVYTYKLYLWQDNCYEVTYPYGSDEIWEINELDFDNLELYIESINRTGVPKPAYWDSDDYLRKENQKIARMLQVNNLDFYHKLLWEKHLHWYCDMIEVRAAYLLDDILTDDMMIIEAKEIAYRELLKGDLERHIKPPYVRTKESDGTIQFPKWTENVRCKSNFGIPVDFPYGIGIQNVASWFWSFEGWNEDARWDLYDDWERLHKGKKRERGTE